MRSITGWATSREVPQVEAELASAHALIHVLLTRECGGRAQVTDEELSAARTGWLTTQLAPGALIVSAR